MLRKAISFGIIFLLIGCGSGLCPLGSAYRTNCLIAGGSAFVSAIGVLDTSFNTTGFVTTPIGAGDDTGYSLTLQADGKILLGGAAFIGANFDFAIARYRANGSLDTTFNTTGFVTTPIGVSNEVARSIVLQPDGKILLGGYADTGVTNDFAIARYHANGSLDTTFNTTGTATIAVGTGADECYTIALQPDGKILLGGSATIGANYNFAVVRYNSNGSLDTAFNSTGYVTTAIGLSNAAGRALYLQPDGKILLAGFATMVNNDFALVR